MRKSIYNVFIKMESQEQCDRMKQLCIDNNLPIWEHHIGFMYDEEYGNEFYSTPISDANYKAVFGVLYKSEHSNEVTEKGFIKLLKSN